MANEQVHVDNILFIVEGVKAEAQYIRQIYEQYYGKEIRIINRERVNDGNNPESYNSILDINWIENANIEKFIETIKEDQFSEGISIVNYFKDKNDVSNYSEAFIIIDADLKDKSRGKNDACEKIALLKELNKIVHSSDDNVELLISSPQLECVTDEDSDYQYISGENYKIQINSRYPSGALGEFKTNINSYLKMNLEKYMNENIDYYDHSMYPFETFDAEKNIIKVRSPLFHLIATKQGIYDDSDLLFNFFMQNER